MPSLTTEELRINRMIDERTKEMRSRIKALEKVLKDNNIEPAKPKEPMEFWVNVYESNIGNTQFPTKKEALEQAEKTVHNTILMREVTE